MACILAKPQRELKGILSFTTSEIDQVMVLGRLKDEIAEIKNRYYIGLHHNWHPVDFEISNIFDFHFLESKDAIFLSGSESLLELDACNFTPAYFSKQRNSPIWDVLIIGRTANFKRPYRTLETIRELFDKGHHLKILWICPMDINKNRDKAILKEYEDGFSQKEKELFTLLNPSANHPFTFSRQELSLFYLSSRCFVHFADVETRCRVAAYAFCAGIPVVGNLKIANILPSKIAKEPTFFEVKSDDYADSILKALNQSKNTNQSDCVDVLSERQSIDRMVVELNRILKPPVEILQSDLFVTNLDIRLGASHTGSSSSNSYSMDLPEFLRKLICTNDESLFEKIEISSSEPEHEIEKIMSFEEQETQKSCNISIGKGRFEEIKITRHGKLRFLLYRVLKFANKVPFIGSLCRSVYIVLKARLEAQKRYP